MPFKTILLWAFELPEKYIPADFLKLRDQQAKTHMVIKTMAQGSYKSKYINFCISVAGALGPEISLLQEELGGKTLKIKPQRYFCLFIYTALIQFQGHWKIISGM